MIEECLASTGVEVQPNAYKNPKWQIRATELNNQFLMALKWTEMVETLCSANLRAMMHLIEVEMDLDFNTVEAWHPLALAAKANSADNLTWDEAMNGPNRAGYWDAMEKELEMLTKHHDAWEVVDHEPWMNVLPSMWAFKCKQFPLGLIYKLKARFCALGDHQIEGIDYFDTFSLVVNWTTVCLLLIMSIILGLSTKQVDCTAAFLHAPIDHDPNWENMMEEECAFWHLCEYASWVYSARKGSEVEAFSLWFKTKPQELLLIVEEQIGILWLL